MKKIFFALLILISSSAKTQTHIIDRQFGFDGELFINHFSNTIPDQWAGRRSICVLPDGKILVASLFRYPDAKDNEHGFVIFKIQPNGSLDASFGMNGVKLINPGTSASFRSMEVQTDGKILLAGSVSPFGTDPVLVRLLPDGRPDSSFRKTGISQAHDTTYITPEMTMHRALILPDKKYKIFGFRHYNYSDLQITALRISEDGKIDYSYGVNGKYNFPVSPSVDGMDAVLHSNGYNTLTGYLSEYIGQKSFYNYFSIRVTDAGKTDSSYGTNGIRRYPGLEPFMMIKTIAAANNKYYVLGKKRPQPDSTFIYRFLYNGDIDSSFGNNGCFMLRYGNRQVEFPEIEQTRDSLLLISGMFPAIGSRMILAIRQDGTIDSSFGSGGLSSTQLPAAWEAISSGNDKIYTFTEYQDDSTQFQLGRYTMNGIMDSSFGDNGISRLVQSGSSDKIIAIEQLADSSFLVAGTTYRYPNSLKLPTIRGWFAKKFFKDGRVDSSFGTAGLMVDSARGIPDILNDMKVMPGNEFLFAGTYRSPSSIRKYKANGTVDTNFGTNGTVDLDLVYNSKLRIMKMAVTKDNKILYTGGTLKASPSQLIIGRLTADGKKDPTFGSDGKVFFNNTELSHAEGIYIGRCISITADNKILIASDYYDTKGRTCELRRFTENGLIDSSFGINGRVTSENRVIGLYLKPNDILVQPDGKIILLQLGVVSRYLPNGAVDSSFGQHGIHYNSPSAMYNARLQDDGKIVIAGIARNNNLQKIMSLYTLRLRADGKTDSSFNGRGILFNDKYFAVNADHYYNFEEPSTNPTPAVLLKTGHETFLTGGTVEYRSADGLLSRLILKNAFPASELTITDSVNVLPCPTVQLIWRTKNETQSDYFAIERSNDGIQFKLIARMPASLNTSNERFYSFTDSAMEATSYYYRVRMWGKSGSILLSNTSKRTSRFGSVDALSLFYDSTSTNGKHILSWTIVNQPQLDTVFVQRQMANGVFQDYARILPAQPADTVSYTFTDSLLQPGTNYHYRISISTTGCARLSSNIVSNKTKAVGLLAEAQVTAIASIFCSTSGLQTAKVLNPPANAAITIQLDNAIQLNYRSADSSFQYPVNTPGPHVIRITYEAALQKSVKDISYTVKQTPPVGPLPDRQGNVLWAQVAADNYQWYGNGILIPGASNRSYNFVQNGNYSYTYSINGCTSVTSPMLNVIATAVTDLTNGGAVIRLFPNPTRGLLVITGFNAMNEYKVQLVSVSGQVVKTFLKNASSTLLSLDLSGLFSGTYVVDIYNNSKKSWVGTGSIHLIK